MNPVLLRIGRSRPCYRLAVIGFAVGLATACLPGMSRAEEVTSDLAERLTPEQLRIYEQYRKARTTFDRQLQAYWRAVNSKREARKARRMLGQAYTADDYITEQPPKYRGPELPSEIARIVTEVQAARARAAAAQRGGLPGERQGRVRLRADAHHRARVQAPLRPGSPGRRPEQGSGGAHLCARDRRPGHLRHAVGHQPDHQAGQADLLGTRLCPAAARQLDQRVRQVR